jgi:hypothetical protein
MTTLQATKIVYTFTDKDARGYSLGVKKLKLILEDELGNQIYHIVNPKQLIKTLEETKQRFNL